MMRGRAPGRRTGGRRGARHRGEGEADMNAIRIRTAAWVGGAALATAVAGGEDWPAFRGPTGDGASTEASLPLHWSAASNVAWKVELPGLGSSSPIVRGDRVIVTAYSGYGLSEKDPGDAAKLQYHVVCLSRSDGRTLWARAVPGRTDLKDYRGFIAMHGHASSTPVADEETVYTFFGNSFAGAWKLADGAPVWSVDLKSGQHAWGDGPAPVLAGACAILQTSDGRGQVVALDRATGREVWRQGGIQQAWSTPAVVTVGGRTELVTSGKGAVVAYDAATGRELWRCAGVPDYVCPSPVARDGIVYFMGGRQPTAVAVRAGASGEVPESAFVWKIAKCALVSSAALHDGRLYWAADRSGAVTCVNAADGAMVFEGKIEGAAGFYASPVVAAGRLYFVARNGTTCVLEAGRTLNVLARNPLEGDGSRFNASPAVAGGRLLIRSDRFLYGIGP
jgi:outer membrane protein assembly factor BamB